MEIRILSYNKARCYLDMRPKQHQKHWLTLTEQESRILEDTSLVSEIDVQKIMLKKAYYDGLNHGQNIIPVHFDTPLLSEVKDWWASLHGAYLATKKVGEFTNWLDEFTDPRQVSKTDFEILV